MSQHEQDPLMGLIDDMTATMNDSTPVVTEAMSPSQPGGAPAEVGAAPANDSGSVSAEGYRGLADELLLQAGRYASPEVRDALAEHIGSGIVAALLGNEGKSDPTERVMLEVGAALLGDGLLPRLQARVDSARQAEIPAQMGPIARWRYGRRLDTENKAAERAAYAKRQEEAKRLRVRTLEDNYMDARDFKPGDTVTLKLINPFHDTWKARDELTLSVEGYEEAAEGVISGVKFTVVKEKRSTEGKFLHDSLPADASVVIRGTVPPQDKYMAKAGRLSREEALVLLWEGQKMPFLAQCKVESARGIHTRESQLQVEQIMINDIPMFFDRQG